ncbi:DNA (cytosine-5)-methyltransferase DRM2 [Sesamum angolense]|uniref:DNA (cytosine-5-)-methyltransferase n=1 Tax=Sesamum angolense TaxID=2727404 RepID=A0AAE1XEE1_9LAMI|nr:DNA (cytosine-5)-methyltransferase DRM2 [Sesamum angolense]
MVIGTFLFCLQGVRGGFGVELSRVKSWAERLRVMLLFHGIVGAAVLGSELGENMDGNASGEESVSVDWTTDDELEILAEPVTSSQPKLATCSREAIAGNVEASSSAGASRVKLINHFVGMGFSEKLVSKAIEEHGEGDTESILNALLTYSTLEDSPEQQLSINSDPSSSDYNETLQEDLSDMDSWSEDEIESVHYVLLSVYNLLCEEKHEHVSTDKRNVVTRSQIQMTSENDKPVMWQPSSLSEKDKKLLALANMGYTVEEASIAMDRCVKELLYTVMKNDIYAYFAMIMYMECLEIVAKASVAVLTDFICAAQMAREEDCYLLEDDLKPKHLYNGNSTNKKRKFYEMCRKKNVIEETIRLPNPMIGFGVPSQQPEHINRSLPEVARGPPYFYYENVALAPKGVWDTISRFLYEVEPEFVDSKYFCATARKRGYVHNLPIENRFPLIPLPPVTIHQAFPLSRKWWPSWDTRDKLNCIQTAIGSAKLTERIRNALERYDGDPPETVQRFVLEQCRKWNLVWVGRNKVAPLEPDEVEMLLGFPKNHTRGGGISRTDRYKSLGNSFQVDTVAYHLSVLKDIYPNGINLLSLFSGIGGAEVALHRLGIKLKNVVSVEKSKVNRDIVKSWWEQTNQRGNLIDFDDVQQIDGERLEQIIDSIGGFDLVVGGSPCNNLAGSNRVSRDGLEGKESSLFYDYFRILDLVKCIMRSRQV